MMSMEDKTFVAKLVAVAIQVIYGVQAANEFRRNAIRELGSHLNKDDLRDSL